MILSIPLVVQENLDGSYFVTFQSNGTFYSGNINVELIPVDRQITYEKWQECFPLWITELTTQKTKEQKQVLENVTKEEKQTEMLLNLEDCTLLTKIGDYFYRLNNFVSLPMTLVQAYYDNQFASDKIKALDNFWYWTHKNTPEIKEMLYNWLQKDDWEITPNGMIVVYRNVTNICIALKDFINDSYNQVKKWKKSPKNYFIWSDPNKFGVYELVKEEFNDKALNLNLEIAYNNTIYTHTHYSENSGQPRLYYIPGFETTMNRDICNSTNETCSSGINLMSKSFISDLFGNIVIACLVNPQHIVSCPIEANYNKMRSCAVYVMHTVTEEEVGNLDSRSTDTHSNFYDKNSILDMQAFVETNLEDNNPKFIGVTKKVLKERMIINL